MNEPQWQQVQQLLRSLDQRQTLWLSGYLAATPQPQDSTPSTHSPSVLIAHGGETGNSHGLALKLADQARDAGIPVEVADLAQLRVRQLTKREHLLVICSTHGDGDPPEPIMPFHDALMADNAPRLEGLNFAVLALGDRSYEQFCVTGQQLDQRLEALGGKRLHARQDCDVDFAEPAARWSQSVLAALPKSDSAAAPIPAAAPATTTISRQNPLDVEVLENLRLSDSRRRQPIHHLELALETTDLALKPGDAVGILADNPPALVAAVLDACNLSGDAAVSVNGQSLPLVQALRQHLDLTLPSSRFLEFWAELSGNDALRHRASADSREQRQYLKQVQIIDLLTQAPATPEPQALVDALRPLQPRLYDVANSLNVIGDELHLTVKDYRYSFVNRTEQGIASRYLLALEAGDSVRLYPHRNARFQLPEQAETPLILIGEGTGIAPYRAFLQELEHQQQNRPVWLIFAEQSFEQDFLYQSDIQLAHANGALTKVDTVFYQDQPGRSLAAVLRDQDATLREWLDQDAHLYFCGDKARLTECEKALAEQLGSELWKPLGKAKRLHRNLY
ncbi:NADPH-sulfite reductase [Alcanivorax hongdengensis A-11-3]|uniref:NADPH-sulfite reductase n=1 Tax=Alcanivorax hongdengensis A-11-3 TaxID=1177179 RepID=L0WAA6_9GAMM|nr:NADPH-sulfite reductase [Alcanivorax hongdengensis A-11-3]